MGDYMYSLITTPLCYFGVWLGSVVAGLGVIYCLIRYVPAVGNALLGAVPDLDGSIDKMKQINAALDEVKEATQKCNDITKAGGECVENMHELDAKSTDMVEKASSWLGGASGLEITLMV